MYFCRLIDENGLFIKDDFVEELTKFTIETPCPSGFYLPKWDGEQWIEGLTQEEVDSLKGSTIEEVTEIDLLRDYVLDLDYRLLMMEFEL